MFVVVADSLQLTASSELPDHKLEAAPQTRAVEEDQELAQHSGGGRTEKRGGGGIAVFWFGFLTFNKGPNSLFYISEIGQLVNLVIRVNKRLKAKLRHCS